MSEDVEVEVEESGPGRRSVMKAAALVVLPVAGVGTVAACSSSSSGGSSSGSGNGAVSVPSSSVPVGGGFVDKNNNIVVTQPQAGVYKAFSAVCTHQGCTVAGVSNNQIICPCHGSIFSAQDGSVVNGPASTPLAAMPAKVSGANVQVTSS